MTQQLDRPAAPRAGRSPAGERRNGQPDRNPPDQHAEASPAERRGDGHRTTGREPAPKKFVRVVDSFQQHHPWLAFPVGVVKKFGEDDAGGLAALVAYYGFFSIFPLLLAMTSVLGFVLRGDEELQRRIVDSTVAELPVVGRQISENVGSLRGSAVAIVIGVVAALWAGLGVVQSMQKAMNSVWDVPIRERPNAIEARLRALATLLVFGIAMLATTLAASVSTAAQTFEPFDAIVAAVLSVVLNSLIYLRAFKILTDRPLGWPQVLPGAVVGGVAFTILQLVGGAIVGRNVRGASDTYGTFAVVIGLLTWLYLLAQMSVAAAEVNVVAARRLWPRSLVTDHLTDADRRALHQHAEVEERLEEEHVAVDLDADEHGRDRLDSPRRG
jgi:YihY family inner membrane protein